MRRTMVEAGEADIVGSLPPSYIDDLKDIANVTVSDNQGLKYERVAYLTIPLVMNLKSSI